MKAIIIIEDKKEELLAAIAAVKEKFGIADKEGLGIKIEDIFTGGWKMGFEMVGNLSIFYSNHLSGAERAIEFALNDELVRNYEPEFFILTDLMFPLHKESAEQANGVSLILDAVEAGIPVTVCSDTDHHQVMFLPKLCRHLEKFHPDVKINLVLDRKDWKKAVDLLIPDPGRSAS